MKIDHRDIIPIKDVNDRGTSWLVSEAQRGRTMLITRNSRPAAVVTNVEGVERLEQLDELIENLQLLTVAIIRQATDTGDRHDLDDVVEELGIDESDDED